MTYPALAEAIRRATTIALTTHVHPDADGLGSELALALALERLGKTVYRYAPETPAGIWGFLPGIDRITAVDSEAAAKALPAVDLMIALDCGDAERLGALAQMPRRQSANLDHHASNTRFAAINVVEGEAACTATLVDRLLTDLGVAMDRVIATCLYAALVFDTGRFLHSNTTAACFRFAARLADTGIDLGEINRALACTRKPSDVALLGLAAQRLVIDADPRLAGICLTRAEIDAVGEPEDWTELVELVRSLVGNQIAYLLREQKDGKVRISLRSHPPVKVGPVAKALGGGGHDQAAGVTVSGPIARAREDLLKRLWEALV